MNTNLKQLIYTNVSLNKISQDVNLSLYLKNRDQSFFIKLASFGFLKPFEVARSLGININYLLCLYSACSEGKIDLINYICNSQNINPCTNCMYFATSSGNLELCKFLYSKGVLFTPEDLCNSMETKNIPLVQFILSILITDKDDIDPTLNDKTLQTCCKINNIDLLELLFSLGFKCKPKHFITACKYDCYDIVKKLIYLKKYIKPDILYEIKTDALYKNQEIYSIL